MNHFTSAEYADIHFVYGLANGNARLASELYAERFPNRIHPNPKVFSSVHQRLRETGNVRKKEPTERHRQVRTNEFEEEILRQVEENSSTSVRCIANNLGANKSTIWNVLHENLLYPFKRQKVHALEPRDFERRRDCSRWFLHKEVIHPGFLRQVLFSDEACFTREGIFNSRNCHIWADVNPHGIVQRCYQKKFSVNVWAGILDNYLIGPYILPNKLNGPTYLVFLRDILPVLLENIPLEIRQSAWFQHDGAPAHFSAAVREHLDRTYRHHWIGRGGPVPWPPRSPDLTPLDFFLWGYMKQIVYDTPVIDEHDLVGRVVEAAAIVEERNLFENVRESALKRFRLCNAAGGGHFEHSL